MDRMPKPAPFKVGTVLIAANHTTRWFADAEGKTPLRWPGQRWTVVEVRPGRQGTLRDLSDEDDDYPVIDRTSDGWNVARAENGQTVRVHWGAVEDGDWLEEDAIPEPNDPPCGGDRRCKTHRDGQDVFGEKECRHA